MSKYNHSKQLVELSAKLFLLTSVPLTSLFYRYNKQVQTFKKMNLLNALRPAARIFPTVCKPLCKLSMQQRTVYTAMGLFIYLVCSQIPLYGVTRSHETDPLYWARLILASSRGTLMELGISPIISAGWLTQILSAMGLFRVTSKQDEKDVEGLQGVLAVTFCFGEAVVAIWSGTYGSPTEMSIWTMVLIVGQLMGAGLVVIFIDDMLRKGYGLGSGISLFICANTAQTIFWTAFSPVTMSSQFGVQFEGAVVALVHFLFTKNSVWQALSQSLLRSNGYNIAQLLGAGVIFLILVYLQRITARVRFINQQFPGWTESIKVKLFFTSNMSVILQSMLISNFYKISQLLHERYYRSTIIKIIGQWDGDRITGGIIWYIAPPYDLQQAYTYPHRTILYTCFVCLLCAWFAKLWIVISKSTPKDYAKTLRTRCVTLPNYKECSNIRRLNQMIPTAAMLGGITIGFLTVMGDLFNVAGSSTGILLSITIIYSYYEKVFEQEHRQIQF